MTELINLKYIFASVVYSLLGVLIFILAYWMVEKMTPENTWKEITEKQNTAVAIVAGAVIIGLAMIISSAIHG